MGQLIILFGPPAVGKMTIGKQLSEHLGYPLLHNHSTIDFVLPYLHFGDDGFWKVVETIRQAIYQGMRQNDKEGLIITYVWHIDDDDSINYVKDLHQAFSEWTLYNIDLAADLDTRLLRNRMEDRLEEKPSKRDIDLSEKNLLEYEGDRMNFDDQPDFLPNYYKLDTTNLTVEQSVDKILKFLAST